MNKTSFVNHSYSALAIVGCLLLGYGMHAVIDFLPPSLYGMLFLTIFLHFEIINSHKLKDSVNWIIKNMGVCFVPAGVGIMEHQLLIEQYGLQLTLLIIISTIILMLLVGFSYQKIANQKEQDKVG